MKSQYLVVATYPSGRRHEIGKPTESLEHALWHRDHATKRYPDENYAVDVLYVGTDGQVHKRFDIDAPVTSCD